ncbi:MAG: xanthine dehydrogenase accessory protein XdhC [Pseudomonadales bacterium]|nr:xanthine dehydrogenase accessory protein XdhC [Pseudomonadales bacterium]MBO6595096.1 xanthine dehydrogenase accessory protein XdhC [Pseudomonadales bacterium]MBO6821345.1 xanthine dehydrogenase accessory protein XdhC [Pseudomonadales bacterium]
MNWQQAISWCHQQADPFAVATVIGTTGSTPREVTKMVITAEKTFDTIGGGQLEFKVIEDARSMLESRAPSQKIDHYPLATKADQCCGGSVTVLIESFPITAMRLAVFGAGHVASALMQVLAQCDARIEWIDSREDVFPESVSSNVQLIKSEDPVSYVDELTDQHRCIIITHDHALDYQLVHALLNQTEIDYVGLIGSNTKAKRFFQRMDKDGISQEDQQRCVCPIGMPEVKGKLPMEIAVSIAAQILSLDPVKASQIKPELSWKEIRQAFPPREIKY